MAKAPVKRTEMDFDIPGVKKLSDRRTNTATVLYGKPGSGKTTLASTWPKPILYIDILDHGGDSIADLDEDDIDLFEVEDSSDIDMIYDKLFAATRKGKCKYKTVIMDTVTQLQGMVVNEVAAEVKRDLKGKRAGDFGTLQKQDWGKVSSKMKTWIEDFRDLPLEIVFIAQEKLFAGDDDGEEDGEQIAPEIGPRMMPSLASALNAAVSTIGQTCIRTSFKKVPRKDNPKKFDMVEKKQFCLRLGVSSLHITKIRRPKDTGAPPNFIVDPTYEDIIAVIKGED